MVTEAWSRFAQLPCEFPCVHLPRKCQHSAEQGFHEPADDLSRKKGQTNWWKMAPQIGADRCKIYRALEKVVRAWREKKTPMLHCSIGQSCCSMTSKRFLESSLNQPKARCVCIRSINQSNCCISVRLLFLFCSRVFISRSYENLWVVLFIYIIMYKSVRFFTSSRVII